MDLIKFTCDIEDAVIYRRPDHKYSKDAVSSESLWNCESSFGYCSLSITCWLISRVCTDTAWSIWISEKILAVPLVCAKSIFPCCDTFPLFFKPVLRCWNMLILYFAQFSSSITAQECRSVSLEGNTLL